MLYNISNRIRSRDNIAMPTCTRVPRSRHVVTILYRGSKPVGLHSSVLVDAKRRVLLEVDLIEAHNDSRKKMKRFAKNY